jgi:hypothetical protein
MQFIFSRFYRSRLFRKGLIKNGMKKAKMSISNPVKKLGGDWAGKKPVRGGVPNSRPGHPGRNSAGTS